MPHALPACSLFTRSGHTWIRIMFAAFCFAAIGQASESAAQLILRGEASHKEGDLNRAATFLETALAELEGNTGDPELVSVAYTKLAFIRMDQGQLADAERLLRNALAICTKRGDQGLPARIVASGNLALALIDRAKYTEADSLTFPAVEEAAAMFGSKSNQYVTLLCIRGSIAMGRDNLPQAIKLLQRAIAIMESKQPDGEELGRAYQNLAAAAAQAGKTKLALASVRRARDTWLSFLPEDHPALIEEQNTLMCIYLRTQQYQKAYAVTMSLLPRAEKTLGPDHPRFAVILSNAAMIYEHETGEAEAADAFHRAYQINLHALGPMHPNTAYALLGYGRTIAKDGQPAQGASLQRQATALLNALH